MIGIYLYTRVQRQLFVVRRLNADGMVAQVDGRLIGNWSLAARLWCGRMQQKPKTT
jgi:hypothetical protein